MKVGVFFVMLTVAGWGTSPCTDHAGAALVVSCGRAASSVVWLGDRPPCKSRG